MPTYEYHCTNDHYFERVLPVADYKTPQTCPCGAQGRRVISMPILKIPKDIRYDSPIDGRPITSEKARREDLARHNCRPYDPEQKKDYHRRIERDQQALDASIDDTIDREWGKMPTRKREQLAGELLNGADLGVARGTKTE